MKKRLLKGFELILLSVGVVACQQQATDTNNVSNVNVTQTAVSNETHTTLFSDVSSVTQSNSLETSTVVSTTMDTTVSQTQHLQTSTPTQLTLNKEKAHTIALFNGSYYYVNRKYGSVIIVNKKHPLAPTYAPGEVAEAKQAFERLKKAMQNKGFAISNNYSGYRSYNYQQSLYQSYVAKAGQKEADTYSARAGYSEHQTGLAYDFIDTNGQLLTEKKASQWLRHNAHHYGFIVRYLPGKEAITGYMTESWHVRYIGQEASAIYESGLTLEEYFNVPGGDYN